jgi:hypothetical protein
MPALDEYVVKMECDTSRLLSDLQRFAEDVCGAMPFVSSIDVSVNGVSQTFAVYVGEAEL